MRGILFLSALLVALLPLAGCQTASMRAHDRLTGEYKDLENEEHASPTPTPERKAEIKQRKIEIEGELARIEKKAPGEARKLFSSWLDTIIYGVQLLLLGTVALGGKKG